MVGILVVCHGKLAEGFQSAASLIVGEREQFSTLALFEGDPIDELPKKIEKELHALDTGEGVLIFVDLFGASPFNATVKAVAAREGEGVDMITGANLPMLLEALMHREGGCDLPTLSKNVLEAGKNQIKSLSELMAN